MDRILELEFLLQLLLYSLVYTIGCCIGVCFRKLYLQYNFYLISFGLEFVFVFVFGAASDSINWFKLLCKGSFPQETFQEGGEVMEHHHHPREVEENNFTPRNYLEKFEWLSAKWND